MVSQTHIADDAKVFLQKTPFFRLLLALICGIVFQVVAGFNFSIFTITFSLGIVLIMSDFLYGKDFRFHWFFGLGTSLLLFSLGLFLTQKADENTQFRYLDKQHTYLAKIISAPTEKARSMLCELRLISNLDDNKELTNTVLAYIAKDSLSLSLQAGERILVNAAFVKPHAFGNPYEFDYPRYLKHKGIAATSYVSAENWRKIDETPPFSIVNIAMQCREKLLSIYKELGISGDEYGVLAALTLGYREELSRDLEASYAAAGVTHVLSVSGLHVAVIFIVLDFLLGFMNRKRSTQIAKAFIIIVLLWFYSFMTGLPPSVVRSALMLSLIVFSKVLNSRSQTYNVVFVSAFFMLIYDPYYLFDVGFQLSYMAVLGIVYFQPKFLDLFKTENKFIKPVWSLLTVSLAAQLVTTPISLYYFHNFPNYFWASNMVIVPMSSGIIYLAFGLFFCYQIPYLNEFAATILTWTLRATNEIIIFIHHLPYSLTTGVWFELWQLAAICLAIALFTIAAVYRHGKTLIAALILTTVLFGANLYSKYQAATAGNKLIVAAMQDGYGVSFVSGTTFCQFTDNIPETTRAMSSYFMKHRIDEPMLPDNNAAISYDDDGFVSFGEKHFFILSKNIFEKKTTDQILELDYLILTNNLRISMAELTKFVAPKHVIIDSSYKKWATDKIKNDCAELGVSCHAIGENGAFVAEWE